jgi:LuxR family maltose regulon positive regulatory protein
MTTPLLQTKLYIPPPRPDLVPRPRLIERLNEGLRLGHRLTLISAPAGFGKTTLISNWLHQLRGEQEGRGAREQKSSSAPLLPSAPAQFAWL